MLPLTAFERAALQDIAADCEAEYPGLAALFPATRVVERDYTGGGFFTELTVGGDAPPLPGVASPLGDRLYAIGDFGEPFGVLVFFKEGYPSLIDCHFFGASDTSDIDFERITFRPWPKEGG